MGLIMSISDIFFRTGKHWYVWFLWLPTIASFLRYGKWFDSLIKQYEKSRSSENSEDLNVDSEEELNWVKLPILGYTVFGLLLITIGCSVFVQIVELPLDSLIFVAMFFVLSILNLGYWLLVQFVVGRQ